MALTWKFLMSKHTDRVAALQYLMIKNAQTTPPNGSLYKCQIDYRGKIRSDYSRLVVFSG